MNGLRTLVRLGFAEERKSYAQTYKGATAALAEAAHGDAEWLKRVYGLLREHGTMLFKRRVGMRALSPGQGLPAQIDYTIGCLKFCAMGADAAICKSERYERRGIDRRGARCRSHAPFALAGRRLRSL